MENNLVYITEANFSKIVKNYENKNNINKQFLYKGKVLQFLPFGYLKFLNKYTNLLEGLSKGDIGLYTKIQNNDTFTKIYEGNIPAYHFTTNCSRLKSDYQNYEIPLILLKKLQNENSNLSNEDIDKKWHDMVLNFRKWFNENKYLLNKEDGKFYTLMQKEWGISKFDKTYEYSNSGEIDFLNFTGEELENKIDEEKNNRSNFYNSLSFQEKNIINFLGKNVYLFKHIKYNGDDDFFWEEIKKYHKNYKGNKTNLDSIQNYGYEKTILLLRNYDKYINNIKKMLTYYINIKINPNFYFEKSLLENLGFKPCGECGKL